MLTLNDQRFDGQKTLRFLAFPSLWHFIATSGSDPI
jgi:hypothetical protein